VSLLGGRRCCRLEGKHCAANLATGPLILWGYFVHRFIHRLAPDTPLVRAYVPQGSFCRRECFQMRCGNGYCAI
jgi:hypothetical protein